MFEKNMKVAYLLDFYGDLLDEHTVSVMKAYYNDDLSLAEVASDVGISRQGIRHIVKKGEELLEFYEERLGLAKRHKELTVAAENLSAIEKTLRECDSLSIEAAKLKDIIEIISKGN